MEGAGYQGGTSKGAKTDTPSTDKKTLEALVSKAPIFQDLLDYRAVQKVKSTYVDGTIERLAKGRQQDGRLHAKFLRRPSTLRLSCVDPNLQNVVADRGENQLAAGFRKVIVASPGCVLIESDFSAIEAVLSGYFMGDPNFIRLAALGVHGYHASHVVGRPANLSWSDSELGKYLKQIKREEPIQYDKSKRCTYGTLFGMGPFGLHKTYPELFPNLRTAAANQDLLYGICPKLKEWHNGLRYKAWKQGYLGGGDHPFGFKHWFWDVFTWNKWKGDWDLGKDAKRVVAFYPQSTAGGILYESCLELMTGERSIGHTYYGSTPIRALIHDSILLEIEEKYLDFVLSRLVEVMTRKLPNVGGLSIGVAIKVGKSWADMEEVGLEDIGVGSDSYIGEWEEEDE